jgi:tetratricopeptide (TPR) repeat protein
MTRLKSSLFLVAILCAPGAAMAQDPAPDGAAAARVTPQPDFFFSLLEQGRSLRNAGAPRDAYIRFARILHEGDETHAYYQEAGYSISLALFDMGLFQAALTMIEKLVEQPSHLRYRDSLQWLVRLHRKIPGNRGVLERIASFPPTYYPEAMLDEINYVVGRYRFDELDIEGALDRLKQVRKLSGKTYIKARYLMGVTYVQMERAREAEQAFKDVLRYFAAAGAPDTDSARFKDLATLALARMFFTVGNYGAAERFYRRVEQSSEAWLDALYEMSWAYFHLEDYARSMGNLWTLDSPYFEEEYFPEAKLLQATILYATCNDREVIALVDRFVPEFQRLKKEVHSILERTEDPTEFYFHLAKLAATQSDKLSLEIRRLFNAALANRRMQRYFQFIHQLNSEIQAIEALPISPQVTPITTGLLQDLSSFRELLVGETGDLARQRMIRVRKDVSMMLADSLRLKFETIRRIRTKIGKAKAAVKVEKVDIDEEGDDEYITYEFDGEYWKDELGSYLYQVRKRCGR